MLIHVIRRCTQYFTNWIDGLGVAQVYAPGGGRGAKKKKDHTVRKKMFMTNYGQVQGKRLLTFTGLR